MEAETAPNPETPAARPRPRLMVILPSILLGVILLGCIPIALQNKMIYFPNRYDPGFRPGEGPLAGFRTYRTADGREQWGYLIEPPAREDAPSSESGAARSRPGFYLVFYGNASSAMGEADLYEYLAEATGCGFFIADYRGYGFNEGKPGEKGLVADALGAYDTLEAEGWFDEGVGVIGQSLGGGVAFALAVERPVDRLIALSAFTSIDAMARLSVPWPLYYFAWNHFPNDERLAELLARPADRRPEEIILLHGRNDEIIPFSMGETLAATPGEGLRFIPVDRAMHNDITDHARQTLVDLLVR